MPDRDLNVNIDGDSSGFEKAADRSAAAARKLERELANQERQAAKARREAERMAAAQARAQERVGQSLMGVGAAMAAGIGLAAKAAIDWESAWTGVRKTVDGTDQQFSVLEGQLRGLTRELPASHEEIAKVAEAAGQLGVRVQDVAEFTKTMVMLGTATNLSSEDAAMALARIMNIMQTAPGDVSRLGSSIVDLGNHFATTEREITEMGLRIAGAGHLVGMSEGQVLGFAAALSSVGIEAEAGGTAISRVFLNINTAVEMGGDKLKDFADVAGMSSSQFAAAFKDDAGSAIASFIEGLNRVKQSGGNLATTLATLGLSEIRVRNALLTTSQAGDLVRRALTMGNQAWKDNTALVAEAEQRYNTTASRLQIARNQINDFAIDIGNTVMPAIGAVADKTASWMDVLGNLPGPVKQAGGVLGSIAGAATLAAGAFMWATPKISEFKKSLDDLGPKGQKFARGLGAVGSALTGPLGAALGVATVAVGLWIDHQAQAAERAREWARAIQEDAGALGANTRALSVHLLEEEGLLQVAQQNGVQLGLFTDAVMKNGSAHEQVTRILDDKIAAMKREADANQWSFETWRAGVQPLMDLKAAMNGQNKELDDALSKYAREKAANEGAAGAAQTHTDALNLLTQQMQQADTTAEELKKSLDALVGGHIKADQAAIAYRGAIDSLEGAIKKNGQTLSFNTEKGRANRTAVINAAKAAADHVVALKEEGHSTQAVAKVAVKYQSELVGVARHLGLTRAQAQALIAKYFEIPPEITTKITADSSQARRAIGEIFTQMAQMRGGVTIPVRYQQLGPGPSAVGSTGLLNPYYKKARGGLISGPGTTTSDSIPAWLSNREYVVNAASTAKYLPILQAINAGKYAKGGLVGGYAAGGLVSSASVPLGEFVDRFMGGKTVDKTELKRVTNLRKDQIEQLRRAERKLADDRRHHRSARTIADDEARVKKERRDVAAATAKLRSAEAQYAKTKLKPGAKLQKALTLGIKNTGNFIKNVMKIADMGFGNLAQQLLEMGGPEAEKYAADLAKMSKSKLKKMNADVGTAQRQQAKLEQLPAILKIQAAQKKGAKTVGELMAQTGLSEDELAAANEVAKLFAAGGIRGYAGGLGPGTARAPIAIFGEGHGAEAFIPYDRQHRTRAMGLVNQVAADFGMTRAGAAVAATVQHVTHNQITVQGAMDPVAVGREIEKVLSRLQRTNGRTTLSFARR